jgi:hypothetical protein
MAVTDALIESTETLSNICDHVRSTFDAAEARYRAKHPVGAIKTEGNKKKATKDEDAMEE